MVAYASWAETVKSGLALESDVIFNRRSTSEEPSGKYPADISEEGLSVMGQFWYIKHALGEAYLE